MLDQQSASAGSLTETSPAAASLVPPRTRRIAILGFGQTVREAPVADPSWDLWGMNGFWRAAKPDFGLDIPEDRWALWLDMHSQEYTKAYGERAGIGDKQEQWLREPHPFPILSVEARPEWPSVAAYPIEKIVGSLGRDYFTSTIAYALALALSLPDVAEVGLWGVDLIHDTEYSDQRPCAEYWIGRAEAAGIKVTVHQDSALLKQRARYGYEETSSPLLRELREGLLQQAKGLSEAIQKNQKTVSDAEAQIHTDHGALQNVQGILGRLDKWERGGRI